METMEIDGNVYEVVGHDAIDGLPILKAVVTTTHEGFDEHGNPIRSVNVTVPVAGQSGA